MSYKEINSKDKFRFNNAKSVFALSIFLASRPDPYPDYRSSHFHVPRRKSICKKNLWERSTSPTRAKCRYAARISFPGRGCLNSRNLRAQSTPRPRYPFGILFNLSLSLYRICSATVDGETKSILYPTCMHARLVHFSDTIATISLAQALSRRNKTNKTFCFALRKASSSSFLKNYLVTLSSCGAEMNQNKLINIYIYVTIRLLVEECILWRIDFKNSITFFHRVKFRSIWRI